MLTRELEEAHQACFLLHSEVKDAIICLCFADVLVAGPDPWPSAKVRVVQVPELLQGLAPALWNTRVL